MAVAQSDAIKSPGVIALLERAATAANVSLSVHEFSGCQEGALLWSRGGCAACDHVKKLRWGARACANSREKAARKSATRNAPVPFLCHMGFSCAAMSAGEAGEDRVTLTFGPFCPDVGPGSLEPVALAGLSELTHSEESSLPFSLSDIPRVSADTVPAVIEWAAESLEAALIRSSGETTGASLKPDEFEPTARSGMGTSSLHRDRYHSADIVAALGGGSQAHLRRLVKGVIEDTVSQAKPALAVKRARAIALVAAALEASERAGLDTVKAWDGFGSFVEACRDSGDNGAFGRAVLRILNTVKKASKGRDGELPYAELNALLLDGLEEGVTLAEVAAALGVHPTAVTHRLQRKFGMSFSEYQGRIRVDTAKELLRKGKLSVVDVARRVGLNDASNFSKLFRKHEGMTPTAYRKRFGKGSQTS